MQHTSALLVNYIPRLHLYSPWFDDSMANYNPTTPVKLTIPVAAVLCETFFFGMNVFPTLKGCDTEQGINTFRGVHCPLCVRDFCHVVCFRAQTPPSFPISHINERRRSLPSLRRNTMLSLSAVMYGVSASHCALNVADSVRAMRIGRFDRKPVERLVVFYLPTINVRSAPSKT